jgi:selenocysteine lyase/cysteine desulfurase
MAADGLDGLAFSGHKMYAPFGAGGLILRKGLRPAGNAAFEAARESGDENVAGVAALGKAIDLLERIGMDIVHEEELKLTRTALRELGAVPGVRIHGIADPDSPRIARRLGVISFEMRHIPHNLLAKELAETAGFGVRTGCHCAQILVKRLLRINPVREAVANLGMKLVPRITRSVLPGLARISFGLENSPDDVRRLAWALEKISGRRFSLVTQLLANTHNATPFLSDTKTRRRMREAIEREASSVFGTVIPPSQKDTQRVGNQIARSATV